MSLAEKMRKVLGYPSHLEKVKSLLEDIPETKLLLAQAQERGYDILLDKNLADIALVNVESREIKLKPQPVTVDSAAALAHELRHIWQDTKVKKSLQRHMSPLTAVAFTRILEGDAYAFHTYIATRLYENTGIKGKPFRADFTPDADGFSRIFIDFQRGTASKDYDARTINEKRLTSTFSQQALAKEKGLREILVAGLDGAPTYLNGDEETIIKTVLSHVRL